MRPASGSAATPSGSGVRTRSPSRSLAYYDVRSRFGLAAQLSIRAISKTVEAYKRVTTIRPRFRRHGAVPYDLRIRSWKGIEDVRLVTLDARAVIPVVLAPYQAAHRPPPGGSSGS